MYTKLVHISLLIVVSSVYQISVLNATTAHTCCTPDQWEGQISVDRHQISYLMHLNATVDVTFDYINSLAFFNVTGVLTSPFLHPNRINESTVYIIDYNKEIEYTVDYGTSCHTSDISGSIITKQCIESTDKLLYSGRVGNGFMTDTYNISLSKEFNNVRVTVQRGTCLPVHLASINSDLGSITDVNIFNVSPGIKDRKIFEKPPQCKYTTSEQRKTKKEDNPLKSTLRQVLMGRMLIRRFKS